MPYTMTRYHLPNPWISGIADFITTFGATRKAKDEAEKGYQAQADAQESQAYGSAFGNIAGGVIGGLAGKYAPSPKGQDLSQLQRLQLASSFVPGLGNVTRTLGQITGDQAQAQRQSDYLSQRIQGQAYLTGLKEYVERYAEMPETTAQMLAGTPDSRAQQQPSPYDVPGMSAANTGMPIPFEDPGSVPLPNINPAATPIYKKAKKDVAAIDMMRYSMSPSEWQAFFPQVQQRYEQARGIIQKQQPPPPPTTEAELERDGHIIKAKDGGFFERDPKTGGYNYKQGPKASEYQQKIDAYTRAFAEQGFTAPESSAKAKQQYIVESVGGQEAYDELVAQGVRPYVDGPNGNIKMREPKDDFYDNLLGELFKVQADGTIAGSDPAARTAAMRAAAAMGEYPPQVKQRLAVLNDKLADGSLTLQDVQGYLTQLTVTYTDKKNPDIPDAMKLDVSRFLQAVTPQMPQVTPLPDESEMSESEKMRYERLGIPTKQSEAKAQKQAQQEEREERAAFERGSLAWEKMASFNLRPRSEKPGPTWMLEVIAPDGTRTMVNRRQDVDQQVQELIAQGYSIPGLDGEPAGIAPERVSRSIGGP